MSWRALLLASALCCVVGCKHDRDDVAAFIAAVDMLEDASCDCAAGDVGCGEFPLATECEQRALRKHAAGLGSWLRCAARATRARAECVRTKDCDELKNGACDEDADDVCGEAPEAASRAIQEDIDRLCLERIDCEDGSVADGRLCNDRIECQDGSDELFCAGGGSSSSTDSAGSGAVTPSVNTSPSMDPGFDAIVETCVESSTATPNINPSCVTCLCNVAPKETISCDATCWALLSCVLAHCPNAPAGSSQQTMCAIDSCADSLGGAGGATALGPVLRGACDAVCPPF